MKLRIMLADDHKMFIESLRIMLEREPDIEVVGVANNGLDTFKLAKQLKPDIVCMDIGMPGMNGIETTRRLVSASPDIKIIALSALADQHYVIEMLEAGASGYVTKAEASDELLRAIRAIRQGRKYVCVEVAAALTDALISRNNDRGSSVTTPALGARERQVLQLIAEGNTSVQIAECLHIAPATVEVHRRNIMHKLNLHKVADLTKYAIRNGITSS